MMSASTLMEIHVFVSAVGSCSAQLAVIKLIWHGHPLLTPESFHYSFWQFLSCIHTNQNPSSDDITVLVFIMLTWYCWLLSDDLLLHLDQAACNQVRVSLILHGFVLVAGSWIHYGDVSAGRAVRVAHGMWSLGKFNSKWTWCLFFDMYALFSNNAGQHLEI